ncbi:MAG: class II fructose-bisphosphate aldolase [Candidatus Humimicrobiaceae bacterium]
MSNVSIKELMEDAQKRSYAVGYFESWDLESALAVAKAAENKRSPVIIGFSGIYLPSSERVFKSDLKIYADMAIKITQLINVPSATLFNESPYLDSILECIDLGFDLVMYTDKNISYEKQKENIIKVVKKAHLNEVAVEAEIASLPGAGEFISQKPDNFKYTEAVTAKNFVEETQIDLLAVNIGQAHLHGRQKVRLNIDRLKEIKKEVKIPLVLHGMSSVNEEDVKESIKNGISKVNISSLLKQEYFESIKNDILKLNRDINPYLVIGSGFKQDINTRACIKVQEIVEKIMVLLGSAGKV